MAETMFDSQDSPRARPRCAAAAQIEKRRVQTFGIRAATGKQFGKRLPLSGRVGGEKFFGCGEKGGSRRYFFSDFT
jgi:hypothetical protein